MRTTVRLDEALLRSAKSYAARHHLTLTSVIEDALRRLLSEEQRAAENAPVDVLVFTGSGTRPGVDVADRQTWQHLVDEDDAESFRVPDDADA
jgi:hypothetical protein